MNTLTLIQILINSSLFGQIQNPLEFHGDHSILFVTILTLICTAYAFYLRQKNLNDDGGIVPSRSFSPYELAILSAGKDRAALTALITLVHKGAIDYSVSGKQIELKDPGIAPEFQLEEAVLNALQSRSAEVKKVRLAMEPTLDRMHRKLESEGLFWTPDDFQSKLYAGIIIQIIPLIYTIYKAYLGSNQGYPIGFLVIAILIQVCLIAGHAVSSNRKLRRAGQEVLSRESAKVYRERSPSTRADQLDPLMFAGVLAISGPIVLTGTPYYAYQNHFKHQPADSNSVSSGGGCGISSCSSSSDGGSSGGCGGGGCGGGGCGG
jgi:uncharacterized protein (TIGR04222 family)